MTNVAFILDLKNSRSMKSNERVIAQDRLSKIVRFINLIYENELKFDLSFSGGDSIQGSFRKPSSAICCYELIRSAIYPFDVRCGVGIGGLIKMPYLSSNMMDGPSYHNASDALLISKNYNQRISIMYDHKIDGFLNQYLSAAEVLFSEQSKKQTIINNIVSLMDPLYSSDLDLEQYYESINGFISENIMLYYNRHGWMQNGEYHINCNDYFIDIRPSIERNMRKTDDVFKAGEKTINRHVQKAISDMLNVSSENISQMIKRGHIEMIRSLTKSASALSDYFIQSDDS